jgi:hypothetical protein
MPPGARRSELRLWLMLALGLMLVFVRSVDLHFHKHIGAPTSVMHLADVSTAHDAGNGDLDVDIQGQDSLRQLPSVDLLPMLLLALPLLFVLVASEARPRGAAAPATPPPWRQRANTIPPTAGPPPYR